jgi:hypothetical protein
VQDVAFRLGDEQAFIDTADPDPDPDEPVILVTFHDEKLQYEFEHGFAPADQLTIADTYVDGEAPVDPDKDTVNGVLAVTSALDDVGTLLPLEQVHPSTTV